MENPTEITKYTIFIANFRWTFILELSNLFEKKFDKKKTHKHSDPTEANVKIISAELYFDNYDKVLIGCVEQKEKSHTLDISLRKKKFTDYINNEAYK